MKTAILITALAYACLGATGKGCVQDPVTPDAGSLGGSPGTGGSPGIGGAPAPICTGACCVTCSILASHDCPESRPTALGASCETVCLNADSRAYTRWARLTASCSSLACVRKSFACTGGRE
jgi:hypothetical protein